MQENEFEKRVQKKMEEFALVPNDEVWKQVEADITMKKRRRVIFYWMLAAILLTGGAGTWLYYNSTKSTEMTNVSSNNSNNRPNPNLITEEPVIKKNDRLSIQQDLIKEDRKPEKDILQPLTSAKTKKLSPGTIHTNRTKVKHDLIASQAQTKSTTIANKRQEDLQLNAAEAPTANRSLITPGKETITELPPHKYLLSQQQKVKQETPDQTTATLKQKPDATDSLQPSLNKNIVNRKNQQNILRKWQYGFTFYGGISDNVTGIGSASSETMLLADRSNSFAFQSSPSVGNAPGAPRLQYKSGFSFGAGIYVKKELTQKLSITAGGDYHFLSATSLVGNRVNATLNVYDSVLQKQTTVNHFYRAGQATSFSNKYHLFKLPVNLQLQLNKNMNKPLVFSIGLSPSFLVASKALYLNSIAGAYYVDKKQFNQFFLFSQTALMYKVGNSSKYKLSIGPALQYNFNSLTKNAIPGRQHLFFTGIKTNILFK